MFGMTIAFALISCAGGGEKNAEEQNNDAATEETVEEVVEVKNVSVIAGESKVNWEGEMMGMYKHSGTIDITEGNLTIEGDQITSGEFVADLTTMQATDENYNPEEGKTAEKLVGHLSSPDFFMVDSFPQATFAVTSHDLENMSLTGNLTIRGVTNEETVEDVEIDMANGTAKGLLKFNRKNYDVAFDHPLKEMVLSDDVTLAIELKM